MRRLAIGILCSVVLLCVCACGASRKLTKEPSDLLRLKREFVQQNNAEYEIGLRSMLERMALEVSAANRADDVAYDVLVIHGGGPKGGFSAGVLQGWGEVVDPAFLRPRFDQVTGSSSGALVAPFAFAGDPASYRRAYELAFHPPVRFKDPSILAFWPGRGSILSNAELKRSIEELFDADTAKRITQEAEAHRTLLIATTDLDLGMGRVWDITLELDRQDAEKAAQRLQRILLASTALPVLFPPVEIDGHLHSDGGIAATLFTGFDVEGIRWVASQWKKRHPEIQMPKIRVWAIVNEKIFIDPRMIRPNLLDVGSRTLEILMEYDRFKALLALAYMFEEIDDLSGVRAEFRFVVIPEDARLPAELSDLGDEKLMHDLIERGRAVGSKPESWSQGAPQLFFLPEPQTPSSLGAL